MRSNILLFMDFDGVICDSLPETLVSSWLAYQKYILGREPSSMPVDFKSRFSRLRPFVKNGEDYIMIQDIIEHDRSVASQAEFDSLKSNAGEGTMEHYKDIFYRARCELVERDKTFWYSLNPIFPPILSALRDDRNHAWLYILSTKKREFILEILHSHDINFPSEHVIDSGNEPKALFISRLLDQNAVPKAWFIDDQIEHLKNITDKRIEAFLAEWGYVNWDAPMDNMSIAVISIDDAVSFIRRSA